VEHRPHYEKKTLTVALIYTSLEQSEAAFREERGEVECDASLLLLLETV